MYVFLPAFARHDEVRKEADADRLQPRAGGGQQRGIQGRTEQSQV